MTSEPTTVLVVDDEPLVVRLVELNLEMDGYRVVAAYDGPSGLRAAGEEHPDVIVLDMMMPGMDGLEVARHLKSDPGTATIPIIFLSARSSPADVAAGLAAGAAVYMAKPFDAEELSAKIAELLKG
ncbi:MAG TPA: response regulator [Acidimicrobiales bacterium]